MSNKENLNEELVSKIHAEILEIINRDKPNVEEIIIIIGNLMYSLGASIDGYTEKGPSIEALNKLYYTNPTVGCAFTIQGLTTCTWVDSYKKTKE